MEYILAALISIPNIFGYEYVGYHECKQVGYIETEQVTVSPASVEMHDYTNNYILFKGINNDGTVSEITCVKESK